ncbi:hypothetical protein ASE67_02625 [Sphingomonas sp. Leaf23]|nr:hypothetical protein ASE67_02625 [Sphingomonas sp. Leaf23]
MPVCVRCDTLADYKEWTAFTGRAPDMIHGFASSALGGSTPYENNIGAFDACLGVARSIIATWTANAVTLGVPVIPICWAVPGATNTQTAADVGAGVYDDQILALLSAFLAHRTDTGPINIRPNWEGGYPNTWPWSFTRSTQDATDYKASFQRIATLARSLSERFKIEWCVQHYCTDTGGAIVDPTVAGNPGPAFFDIVAPDVYVVGNNFGQNINFSDVARSTATLKFAGFPYGARYLADYARANGKQMSFPEWGIGADSPGMMRDYAAFIQDPSNRFAYHGVWNKNASPPFFCRVSNRQHPKKAATYLDSFVGTGKALTEQSETSAYALRATAPPVATRRAAIDKLYARLKQFGLLSKLDEIYLLAGADNDISRLGLKLTGGGLPAGNGLPAYKVPGKQLVINGAPIFTADQGWQGTGTYADYLSTGLNPAAGWSGRFVQNSAHMGILSLTAMDNAGTASGDFGSNVSSIGRNTASTWVGRPNTAADVSISAAGRGAGHIMWNRTAAGAWQSFFNGAPERSGTDASTAIITNDLHIGRIAGIRAGVNRLAVAHFGAALTVGVNQNDPLNLYSAILEYAQAVGLNP